MSVQLDLGERLSWPFFGPEHHALARLVTAWSAEHLRGPAHGESRDEVDAQARKLVSALGDAGITRYCVRAEHGGALEDFDSRAICLIRESLAYHDGLADFAFAMQGLGSGSLSLAGEASLQQQYLPRVAAGTAISAFALSEPNAGSDVAAMQTSARLDGDRYVLNGTKTWISNGGIADLYCVFARTSPRQKRADGTVGAQGITAFLVEPNDPGFSVEQRIDVIAPHPLGTLRFDNCRIPVTRRIGVEGDGFKLAMRTLDIFRASVAAAALGFARRALDEAVAYSRQRAMFGKTLADFQLTQAAIAEMATAIDAADLSGRVAEVHGATSNEERRHGKDDCDRERADGDR